MHYRFELRFVMDAIPLSIDKVKCYLEPLILGSFRWTICERNEINERFLGFPAEVASESI